MNVLVFEIKTIPDIEGGQHIYDLQGLDDKSTAKALFHISKQQSGCDFLPLHLQKIASISVVYRGMGEDMGHEVSVRSLGTPQSNEADLLNEFFELIEARKPTLVSWNGSAFDLPVIHYRSLKNSVNAPGYWEKGNRDSAFRHDNYLSRYHDRHTDLNDVLASYQDAAKAPLDHIATLLGFPGTKPRDGALTWNQYQAGNLQTIRDDCETDVLNIYLIYLRYQSMRGQLDSDEVLQEYDLLRNLLDNSVQQHLQAFSKNWA
jgi:predicted PolB exonuclease-like 3'-5' exonuclease